jgi:ArsR family transcriptional regulator
MRRLLKFFRALNNTRRLKIIGILLDKTLSVSEISERINLSFKSTSKHLRLLENAGLIERTQRKLYAFYKVKDKIKKPLRKLLKEIDKLDI